jgi:phosphoketolase
MIEVTTECPLNSSTFAKGVYLRQMVKDKLIQNMLYIAKSGEDRPEIHNRKWPGTHLK